MGGGETGFLHRTRSEADAKHHLDDLRSRSPRPGRPGTTTVAVTLALGLFAAGLAWSLLTAG